MEIVNTLDLTSFSGKVFVVGDIHGYKEVLLQSLESHGFVFDNDILLSVGDLIDRGPLSFETGKLLEEGWFYAVRGNHEQMFLLARHGKPVASDDINHFANQRLHIMNGGGWVSNITPAQLQELTDLFCELPYVLDVLLPEGKRIGILHATYPNFRQQSNWNEFIKMLQLRDISTLPAITSFSDVLHTLLWAEDMEACLTHSSAAPSDFSDLDPKNVDGIYVGHRFNSSTHLPRHVGKFHFLDVGTYHQRGEKTFHLERVL